MTDSSLLPHWNGCFHINQSKMTKWLIFPIRLTSLVEISGRGLHLLPGLVEQLNARAVELLKRMVMREEQRIVRLAIISGYNTCNRAYVNQCTGHLYSALSRKGGSCGLDMWNGWREKDYQSRLYMDTWREREAEGGKGRSGWTTSGKTWRRKHRFDPDWRGDQKQRGLEESCKSPIVSTLMEGRKEEWRYSALQEHNEGVKRSYLTELSKREARNFVNVI